MTIEQAEVLTRVLDTVDAMAEVDEGECAAAGRFLVAQCQTLTPRDLARAGQALVEALTATPSEDDPADAAALAREQERAEAVAQGRERSSLTVTRRRGKLLAILEPGSLGDAVLQQWLRKADKPHAGSDGFEDTRTRSEHRGDALVDRSGERQDPLPGFSRAAALRDRGCVAPGCDQPPRWRVPRAPHVVVDRRWHRP